MKFRSFAALCAALLALGVAAQSMTGVACAGDDGGSGTGGGSGTTDGGSGTGGGPGSPGK